MRRRTLQSGIHEFAIVDVETTGLFPERSDRILEIAVIRIDQDGSRLREYTTLVNPMRDVGRTDIHGISARDVKQAPKFDEIAGDVISNITGAIVVAHNADFDVRFLNSEFRRASLQIPAFPYICTMHLAQSIPSPPPGRSLECACDYFGLDKSPNHSAYTDADATVSLFNHCFQEIKNQGNLAWKRIGLKGSMASVNEWPQIQCSGKHCCREKIVPERIGNSDFIASLIAKLPSVVEHTPKVIDYLALLDRVLEDRSISQEEGELLLLRAIELGLLQEQVTAAHHSYLSDLAQIACQDRCLTNDEKQDLELVRRLLGIHPEYLAELIANVIDVSSSRDNDRSQSQMRYSLAGKRVCFTGSSQCLLDDQPIERHQAELIATEAGLIVDKNVTKRLDFLVAADVESISGKAKKARDYGIRIISEPEFWKMLGLGES